MPTQNSQDLEKSTCGRNPKTSKAWKSYRSISLLCVPYKILKRLIYAHIEPLIDPLLPKEQAGLQCRNSTVDQVVLLTQNIEDSFEARKKAGVIFVNLIAASDTVWHHGLTYKLLRLLPDKHMVKMIMELVQNRSSPLPPVTASKAGYVVLKMAFLRDRSWLPSYLTSICMIFLP